MRIVLDLQGAQTESRYRGIGRYTLSLAKAIIRNRGEHEIFIVLNGLLQESIRSIRLEFADLLPNENIHVWYAIGPVHDSDINNQWRREAAELIREAFIQSLSPDVIHIPSFFEGYIDNAVTSIGLFDNCTPISVTMLDLIPLLNPEEYLTPNPLYQKHYLRKIEQLKLAKKLFAISESARQEALDNLPYSTQDVLHQSIAIEPFFKHLNICKHEYQIRRLYLGISKPFVLYTGGADSRKNLPTLIQAYAALPSVLREQHQLVFAGRIPEGNITELRLIAEQAGLTQEELHFTGYTSDNELVELYNLCELFVFPSWHEGFGLPVLEAMACGAPAIAANTSSLPEVIGIAEALFCPFSTFDISNKIRLALTDSDYKNRLKKNSLKQVKKFSWDSVAKDSIKSFEEMQQSYPKIVHQSAESICAQVLEKIEDTYTEETSAEDRAEILQITNTIKYKSKYKNLFIDISELFQRDAATGIQRVTRSLLLELLKNPPADYRVQPVYATPDHSGYYYANSYIKKNKLSNLELYSKPDHLIDYHSGDTFLGLDLQHQVVIAQQDLLRKMRNDGVYVSFVVYDLLPIFMPHTFPDGVEEIHKQWLTILADMDHFLCISKSVATELSDWLCSQDNVSTPHPNISWFHLGADIESSMPSKGLPAQSEKTLAQLATQPSFLCVGTLEPRKGQAQVLSAFEILWQQGFEANLVLIGKQGWHVDKLIARIQDHPEIDKKLFWFNSVSDEFLDRLYSSAYCLISASEGEGFGLPIIEAMKYNLPIIARDIPVSREIAGDKASYFVGSTANSLAIHIRQSISLDKNTIKIPDYTGSWLTWFESAQAIKDILFNKTLVKNNIVNINCSTNDSNAQQIKKTNVKSSKYKKLFKKEKEKNKFLKINIYKIKTNHDFLKIKISNLESKSEALKQQLISEKEKEKEKEIYFDTLKSIQEKEVFDLKNIIAIKQNELEFIKEHIEEKNAALSSQHEHLDEKNKVLSELQEHIEEKNKYINHLILSNSKNEEQISQLHFLNINYENQIQLIKTSNSWRITYPLRLFTHCLRWLIALPVRAFKSITRIALKSIILFILNTPYLRKFILVQLKSYPSIYDHLKRFHINRNTIQNSQSRTKNKSSTSSTDIKILTPHAHKIYLALKNSITDNKE